MNKPQTYEEAFKNLHDACVELGRACKDVLEDELHLETLVKLWSEDIQMYTGQWWWED